MPFVPVALENSEEIKLYYEDHGSGDPVVLIHGWPLSGRSWEKQVPALLDAGYRVITYDRRGFGESSKPTLGYNYDTLAKDLATLLAELDLQNVTLVGFSMGGGEVARYLGHYGADRVKRAAFISAITPYLLKTADNPEGADQAVFEGIKKGIQDDRPAFLAAFLSKFYNVDQLGSRRISNEAVHLSWIIAAHASPVGTLTCVDAWLTDFRQDLAQVTIPTLIVHGDADQIVPLEVSAQRMPAVVKNSKLVVIPGGPHGLNWTHAEDLNRELLSFLGQASAEADPSLIKEAG